MRKRGLTSEDVLLNSVVFIAMAALVISIVYPFWAMLVDSFSTRLFSQVPGFKLWPKEFSAEAFSQVFAKPIVAIAYLNTVYRTVLGTALTVVLTLGAAYALSKRALPFRRALTLFIVFTMFFGGGLIPTYLLVRGLGLVNTRFVLIFPFLVGPFALMVTRNFMYSIPDELEESAFLDGANEIVILVRIVAPLSLPIIATVCLWTAVQHWNEWFSAMIYTTKRELMVMQLLLRRILIENMASSLFEEAYEEDENSITENSVRAATLFVAIGPIILIYPFIQKYFVKGVMVGAVKQ